MEGKILKNFIKNALIEDIGNGDHTSLSTISKNSTNKAHLIAKDKGIIAGVQIAKEIFKEVDKSLRINILIKDGSYVNDNDIIFTINGRSLSILSAERLVLNCMQRMSAIATKTHCLNNIISSTNAKILDTRKTTPLNRGLEKLSVKIGGGHNHRFSLDDMILIKDNHIDFAGDISKAIRKAKRYLLKNDLQLPIVVEARNTKEIKHILKEGGVNRILLDNFSVRNTKKAIDIIGKQCKTESSGGINESNILKYAKCGVDFISVGAITHSVSNFDLSLKAY